MSNRRYVWRLGRTAVYLLAGLYFFFIPGIRLAIDLNDPALRTGAIPRAAWRLHESLAPRYAKWAQDRVASKRATQLNNADVAGTEWPLFGSVFYLLSLESLEKSWEIDRSQASEAPAVYARASIEAAADLVIDPNHATWVRQKWGANYLHHQDLFYRFLLISAMTSYTKLTGDPRLVPNLRDQVNTLSTEIEASPHGWIDDYPGECFPTDIIGAVAAIRRADEVLKTDHSTFVKNALRGFQGAQLAAHGLPPYNADAISGAPLGDSRGTGNSYALIFAPEIWSSVARDWYASYDANFWQRRLGMAGFREFSKDTPASSTFADVDSAPVLLNYGVAASAFGVAAARVNGRMDEAGPLSAEMLASSWPMPDGRLLLPRLLSKASDAPYIGEAAILFCLTRQPSASIQQSCAFGHDAGRLASLGGLPDIWTCRRDAFCSSVARCLPKRTLMRKVPFACLAKSIHASESAPLYPT
jgi:hypothetical protein